MSDALDLNEMWSGSEQSFVPSSQLLEEAMFAATQSLSDSPPLLHQSTSTPLVSGAPSAAQLSTPRREPARSAVPSLSRAPLSCLSNFPSPSLHFNTQPSQPLEKPLHTTPPSCVAVSPGELSHVSKKRALSPPQPIENPSFDLEVDDPAHADSKSGNWDLDETLVLINTKKQQCNLVDGGGLMQSLKTKAAKWEHISRLCAEAGVTKNLQQCLNKWNKI